MAYYDEDELDEIDPNQPPAQTGPESAIISGTPQTAGAASSQSPDNPGRFVGIDQYLAQNKPQSAKLAGTVGDYVSGKGTEAESALISGQNKFNQSVDNSQVNFNQDLFDEAKLNPVGVAGDATKKADFLKMRDASYKGPSSFAASDEYAPINMSIQNALGTANKTASTEGRSSLLADMQKENKQKVSRGAANLDSALLSVSPDSKSILQGARDSIKPLGDQLTAAGTAGDLKIGSAKDQTAKTQKAIADAFSGSQGVQGKLEADLTARSDASRLSTGADADIIKARLQKGEMLTPGQLQKLGLTKDQYLGLVNDQSFLKSIGKTNLDDLGSFATFQTPGNQINPQNIAGAEDYAKYAALNDLMGTSNGFLSDPTQAGKANFDTADFNYANTYNALPDRVNNIKQTVTNRAFPSVSFEQLNYEANLNREEKPGFMTLGQGLASKAYELASKKSTGNDRGGADGSQVLKTLEDELSKINKAYGTKLKPPPAYFDKAMKSIEDNSGWAEQYYNERSSSLTKVPPSQEDKVTIAKMAALTTYLSDLSKDPSATRVANAPGGSGFKL